jgi:hypothetical protein
MSCAMSAARSVLRWTCLGFFILGWCGGNGYAQSSLVDEFKAGALDWASWCPCQIDMKDAPVKFLPDPDEVGDGLVSIMADEAALGGNVCHPAECKPPSSSPALGLYISDRPPFDPDSRLADVYEEPEPLGPSFVIKPPHAPARRNPYCTADIQERHDAAGEETGACFQRQELRLQDNTRHRVPEAFEYSIRFRMPRIIEDEKNSVRWVTAQWKHEPVSAKYAEALGPSWSPSPFLAQRFDDGVLHVTVQDEDCRCIVASAPRPDGSNATWKDGTVQNCLSTRPTDPDGTACASNLTVQYGPDPVLTSPRGQWVEMTYRVQADRSEDTIIEVTQDGRFIVRVTGKIGYALDPGQTSYVKFKFGPYRDYMPFVHEMEIDSVSLRPLP